VTFLTTSCSNTNYLTVYYTSTGIAGAFYSAKTLCRIISQFERSIEDIAASNLKDLAEKEFLELKSMDQEQAHLRYTCSGPAFFHLMIHTGSRKEFVRVIMGSITGTEVTHAVVDSFIDKSKEAISSKSSTAQKTPGGARVSPE